MFIKIEQKSEHKVPKRNSRPFVSVARGAEMFRELLSYRRLYRDDDEFFTMGEMWEDLASDIDEVSIKFFEDRDGECLKRAGVIHFDGRTTLVLPQSSLTKAKRGSRFVNFTLAHEFSHVALGHHDDKPRIMNFQLSDEMIRKNLPPTVEEYEANLGAIFLQCGVALFDTTLSPATLAARAYTEEHYVKNAMRICRLNEFRQELEKLAQDRPRVVL
ncbi:hypothetical protein [uncultured Roseobacter sp.]|uniref:hypothetical protein n=1 Tax=uncultured Roseobacter sp. TaxID=114847 RepID=UPI00262F6AD5|nr:hypothetical protein [uncultured Roseobacter sp.]